MGNPFKSKIVPFFALVFLLSACGDDDSSPTIIDEDELVVSITSLENNEIVWKMVDIDIEALDDSELDQVKLFVDGALVATLEAAPFSFDWNTEEVTEGIHTIKVNAIDVSGKEASYSVDVVVRNVLLSLQISDNTFDEDQSFYIFLSDEQGKTLGFAEAINGQSVEIRNNSFNGESFFLTEASIYELTDLKEISIRTYSGVKPGTWSVYDYESYKDGFAGEATVEFEGIEEGFHYNLTSNGERLYINSYYDNIQTFKIKKDPSKLIVIKSDGISSTPDTYQVVSDIGVGSNNKVTLANITMPLSYQKVDLPASTSGSLNLFGLAASGDVTERYRFDQYLSDAGNENVYYPGDAFPQYYSTATIEGDAYYYESSSFGIDDFIIPIHNVQASLNDNVFTYTASGDITLCYLTASADVAPFEGYAHWAFISPVGEEKSFVMPEIPNDIHVKMGETLSFDTYRSYGIMKLPVDSYDAFVSGIADGTEGLERSTEMGREFKLAQYSISEAQDGGRHIQNKLFNPIRRNR